MATDRAQLFRERFLGFLDDWARPYQAAADPGLPPWPGCALTGRRAVALFESQLQSRCVDLEARALRARGQGFYTIASAGHEGNVVLGDLLRPDDPCFLHYRSGALFVQRLRDLPGATPVFDLLLSLCASTDDPCSGGRHKVFGSQRAWIPPQTSTIASHLPKAFGAAFALERSRRLGLTPPVSADAIICCSAGDASYNHAAALTAVNASLWCAHQHLPMPVLWVCEDNGIGISVRTPEGWLAQTYGRRAGLAYFAADGCQLAEAHRATAEAIAHVRARRRPAFLHLRTVRLWGHAGSDLELGYRDLAEIETDEARDPIRSSAQLLIEAGLLSPGEIRDLFLETLERVAAAGAEAATRPHLTTAAQVMAPLFQHRPERIEAQARALPADRGALCAGGERPQLQKPRTLAALINGALAEALARYPELLIFGEDVARKGGVYGVTKDLARTAGAARVFNTLLDETSILGLAIGAGQMGLLPVCEIQYLAYLHNAQDQLRGEAATLAYFSGGQYTNPMVVRIAALGYQKGFGGHFHNDNSIAVLRDIPGLVIACPARGADAVGMLRTCLAAAKVDGRVVIFLEPIALYHTRDLHADGDEGWLDAYPPPGEAVALGQGRVYHPDAADLTIITYGNGLYLSLRAARRLAEEGLHARVFDLRWIAPIDREGIQRAARATGRALVVDEGRRTGGVSEALCTLLAEAAIDGLRLARVTGQDCFIPLGDAARTVLPSEDDIIAAARALVQGQIPAQAV